LSKAEESDVVMLGCGIGVTESTKQLTYNLISNITKPFIIDADGLNCLSENIGVLKSAKAPVLLTPHPGEMSRLTGLTVDYIQNNRVESAKSFSEEYNVTLLLKGYETVICNSKSEDVYINKTGNTGLSKGGSGDLLSGIIAGLVPSQNGELFKSAVLGAFIHGLTADILKEQLTEYAMLPTDCAKALPEAFKMILNSQ
ncbi:MAG: NAD(P)H-hydrate dehydratase, partial [Acutalibacteraceae bacterium]